MPINTNQQFEQASIYSDLGSLNSIREQGLSDEYGAVKKAAKEFEAFFMNMMLKTMRQSAEVIGDNSLTGSEEEKMFIGMMDEQMSADLSQQGHLGIADLMMSQLSRQFETDNKNEAGTVFENERVQRKNSHFPNTAATHLTPKTTTPEAVTSVSMIPIVSTPTKVPAARTDDEVSKLEGVNSQRIGLTNTDKVVGKDRLTQDEALTHCSNSANLVKPEKKSLFDEVSDFITDLLPAAQSAAEKLNVDPRILIAQAALETGWGKFVMHDESGQPGFNLFGIKAGSNWSGDSIKINTLEVENQEFKKVNASFRKYEGFNESFEDYVNFIKQNPRYQKALALAHNAQDYVKELQASGYATDPNYANKIMRIFKESSLQEIDIEIK